jgi:hypothetical protein
LYLLFVLFLAIRAYRLKSRVAEIVDLAAYRAGLQRIPRKSASPRTEPTKIEPASDVG